MTGRLVGHYRILEKIGAGAMGEIFRAHDERLDRDVALKFIRPASSDNPDHLRRFEQEARAAAALNHPNIVAIHDIGFDGATPYIVSELLEGQNFRERLLQGPIPARAAGDYCLQIAHALAVAHDRHIVHRDLKPENLFLTNEGRVKVLDFGVAKLQVSADEKSALASAPTVTKHGAIIGTVAYMSPEQVRGKSVDHRSDLFSLGAILYEMLTGRRAFSGETDADTMTAVLREIPPELDFEQTAIPAAYCEIVRHCLEKDPENRFQSAKDLAFALQTLSGTSSGTIHLPKKRRNTNQGLAWGIVALLAAATVILAILLLQPLAPLPVYSRVTFELGTVYSARFAPADKSIIYSASWNGRPIQLFTTVANSLQAQPLNPGNATLLSISKRSELALAAQGTPNGQLETTNGMLAIGPLAGGSPREVMPDVRWADWDAEGKQLAIVRTVDNHSRLEYPIGTMLYQSAGWISNVRFSPRGDKIAFMDHPSLWDNRGSLCVSDLAGHVQTLSSGPWDSEHGIAWRPDGKEVWFSAVDRGNTLNLMAVDLTGKLRLVLNSPEAITLQDIAPDGRVLATMNTKRLEMALGTRGAREDSLVSWHDWNVVKDISQDNRFVLFEDASEAAGSGYGVALRKSDGSLPIRLGDGSAGGLSPDGKWAISISTTHPEHLTLLPIGPGQPRSVVIAGLESIQNGWVRFLADGQHLIVFGNEAEHSARCYVVGLTGERAKPITPEGTSCGPSSPDGRFIASDGPNSTIALYPVDGGSPRILPKTAAPFNPVQWSSDNTALYGTHVGELPAKIYKLEIATGKETMLQELRPATPAGVVMVAPVVISRDGTHFAYSYSQILSVLYVISGLH